MVQDWKIKLRVWSRVGGVGGQCGPGQNDQAEGVDQEQINELRVWSRAKRSGRGCGPGPETQAKGVVQGWMIRLWVWSRPRIGNQGSTLGLQNNDAIGNWKFHTRPFVD